MRLIVESKKELYPLKHIIETRGSIISKKTLIPIFNPICNIATC